MKYQRATAINFQNKVFRLQRPWSAFIPWLICLCGSLFYLYEYILRIEPSVMQSQLLEYFDIAHASTWGSLVGLYYLAYTPTQLIAGPIIDHWGPRRVLASALMVCVLALFMFYVTPFIWLAGIGRLFVGFGSAFAYIGATRLAVIWLSPRRFALFAGLTTAAGMMGAISGNLALSEMVAKFGWFNSLNISLYLGLVMVPFIWLMAQDDYKYLFAGNHFSFKHISKQLGKVLAYRQVWLAGCIAGLLYVALSAMGELWGPATLQYIYGMNAQLAIKMNSLIFWGALFGAPFAGWLSDLIANRRLTLVVACAMCLLLSLLIIYCPIHSLTYIAITWFLYGFFAGFEIIAFALAREHIGTAYSATAIALVNMLGNTSGLIYQPLIGWLLDFFGHNTVQNHINAYQAIDYQKALSVIPLSLLVAIALGWFLLRETYAQPVDAQK